MKDVAPCYSDTLPTLCESLDRISELAPAYYSLPIGSVEQAICVAFAPVPTAFNASAGVLRPTSNNIIYKDGAGAQSFCSCLCFLEVVSEYCRGEAVVRFIRQVERLLARIDLK